MPEDFAQAIRHLQGNRPANEVARRAGVSPGQWSRWIQGKSRPDAVSQQKIAKGLEVSLRVVEREAMRAGLARLEGRPYPDALHDQKLEGLRRLLDRHRRFRRQTQLKVQSVQSTLNQFQEDFEELDALEAELKNLD